ncbi:C2 calcium-dependent domain-containing protein 4C [Pangasianodon hypophthalmus]|uniref:C2 calcium-dependent domain-containing protein 4C n=1 Tax=Pangasianodon hypophthalmus TaxID=310915 RepID=UPI00147A24F6|nr:C2 calcium-dependent domain-containing protein 4C [Pangasianodon hypophthalmus]
MWILRKVQESAESFPMEISRLVGKNSDEISAKANLLNKLHSNVLTPDKIPDFFLPPRLSRRSLAVEGIVSHCLDETGDNCSQTSQPNSDPTTTVLKTDKNKGNRVALRGQIKPIPFSLKNYESGFFESPNTRRKESLFHSALSSYTLERVTNRMVPKLPSIALLKVDSMESDTSSSADSSPHSSPPPIRSKHGTILMTYSSSKESLHKDDLLSSKNTDDKTNLTRDSHVAQPASSTLAPPLQFPLDTLHCQERLHCEHILLLPHRGFIRLSASHANMDRNLSTIRIRVVSVEDLREPGDLRPLNCGLTLSLSPGKLQRQHSAIIRNCRNPVFNEDFFFTEPEGEEQGLRKFALQVKVLEKNSGLGRAAVHGVISKPLTELLAL